jgi:hypothetical protein
MAASWFGYLCRHGVIDSIVGLVVTEAIKDTVTCEQFADRRLDPGEAQGHAGLLGEIEDLAHLGRALGVDEVDSLAIEHDPGDLGRGQRDLPDPVLQGIGGGEEQAAVQRRTTIPENCSSPGCSSSSRKA